MTPIDEQLFFRYKRAEEIAFKLTVGGSAGDGLFHLIIDIQEKIAEAEENFKRANDKSDIGAVYPKEIQERMDREKQQQKEEEEEWGKLNLDGVNDEAKIEEAK
jgi:hypothetical protein